MRFEEGIGKAYRTSVEDAFDTILDIGNDLHRIIANHILKSDMLVRVQPVSKLNASGVTGLIDPDSTNERIEEDRLGLREALGEIYIAIAEETIDIGGKQGCEGTFVHEGRHAYDFAQTIESLSNADVNPLSIYDPTLYELEWEAHKISGEYMIRTGIDKYLDEGLQLMILGRQETSGPCYVDDAGIGKRLCDSYGLTSNGNQGPRASQLLGLRLK